MNQDVNWMIDKLRTQVTEEGNDEAIAMLETLGNKVAEQAAVIEAFKTELKQVDKLRELQVADKAKTIAEQAALIEKLRESLKIAAAHIRPTCPGLYDTLKEALAIPTDSKQILIDWMREQLVLQGYSYSINDTHVGFSVDEPPDDAYDKGSLIPVYALPECLR